MQARTGYLSGSVKLKTHDRGKPREFPAWEFKYRLPDGTNSQWIVALADGRKAKAWTKKSRPPEGHLTKAQAETAAQAFLAAKADTVPRHRLTFGRACNDFLNYCEFEKRLRGSTVYEYRRIGKQLCARGWRRGLTWEERPVNDFAEEDITSLRQEMAKRLVGHQSMNQFRRVLRGALGKNHPALEAWPWTTVKAESEGDIQYYSIEQVELLKRYATDDRDRAIFTLATEAGPRKSEILALRVSDVDFNTGMIRFAHGYTEHGGLGGTKGHRMRSVPMSDNIRTALTPYCADRDPEDVVFAGDRGEHMAGSSLYRRFKAAAKRALLPEITFHELRHTFGTQMMASGKVDIYTLQRWMGHEDIKTTQIYLHYAPNPLHAAVISSVFSTPQADVLPFRRAS